MNELQVEADLKNIDFIEEFIAISKEIPDNKRSMALIIATEVFDNIAEHAVLTKSRAVRLAVSDIFFPRLCFSYYSSNFDHLLQALKKTKPHFDSDAQRYRGFGLLMTKNLARRVSYQQQNGCVRIVVYL